MATKTTKKKITKTSTTQKKPAKTKSLKMSHTSPKKSVLKKQAAPKKVASKKTTKIATKKGAAVKTKNTSQKVTFVKKKETLTKKITPTPKILPQKTISEEVFSIEKDISTLSSLGSDLDMMIFKRLILGGETADIIYSSDDTTIVCKVLVDKHSWTIDTTKPIENCSWEDETGYSIKPCKGLLIQTTKLHEMGKNVKIIPAIVLMRGSIKNEKEALNYFQKHHIQLVKYNDGKTQNKDDLNYLLQQSFTSFLSLLEEAPKATEQTAAKTTQINKLLSAVATLGKIGYFPKGSGTLGALVALPIAYFLSQTYPPMLWIVTGILFVLGLLAVRQFTSNKKEKDPSCVIIDEVVGQLVAFSVVIPDFMHWPILFFGFVLFRFFDIFKFGPVAFWDKRKNPFGVMLDDVVAGIFAGFILAMLQVIMVQFFGL